jgi:TPR repeat protein
LQKERDRTEAMARDSARLTVGARVTPAPAASIPVSKAAQTVEVAAMAQPAVRAQGDPEATRLVARASALLGQGDIGGARTVLERAAEAGSAQASFMLAETYDPGILSAWGTYGTRGEVTKARELYAKAHAGGIQEAKDRFDALRQ